MIVQLMQTPRKQLFSNPYRVYFQRLTWRIRLKDGQNLFFELKLGSKAPRLTKIFILRPTGCRKLVDSSKWLQELVYYICSQICIPIREARKARDCWDWWNPPSRPNLLKLVSWTLIRMPLIVGDWCLRQITALFTHLISTQSLISLHLGTITASFH